MNSLALLGLLLATLAPVAGLVSAFWGVRHRHYLIASLSTVFVIAAFQVSPLPYLVGVENLFPVYRYESTGGEFYGSECFKSHQCSYDWLLCDFRAYREANQAPEARLVRTFRMPLWRLWRWWEFATHPRWKLEYQPARYCGSRGQEHCVSPPEKLWECSPNDTGPGTEVPSLPGKPEDNRVEQRDERTLRARSDHGPLLTRGC